MVNNYEKRYVSVTKILTKIKIYGGSKFIIYWKYINSLINI